MAINTGNRSCELNQRQLQFPPFCVHLKEAILNPFP
jgi:hypothetical protein